MTNIDLLISDPIAWVAIVSLVFNFWLVKTDHKNSRKIGAFESTIKLKDERLNTVIADRDNMENKVQKTISSFTQKIKDLEQKHEQELKNLTDKIKHLSTQLSNKNSQNLDPEHAGDY